MSTNPTFCESLATENLLTLPQAAKQLNVPVYTLRRAAKAGLIPTYTPFSQRVRVRLSEVVVAVEVSSMGGQSNV